MENEKKAVSREEILALAYDVQMARGVCNFYWACWSIMVEHTSKNFGYLEHGIMRIEKLEKILQNFDQHKIKSNEK